MGWARLAKGYQYHAGEGGVSGQEVYAVEASGTSSLPTIGTTLMLDPAGVAVPNAFCRAIDSNFPEGDDATRSVTCRFSTFSPSPGNDDSGSGPGNPNPDARKMNSSVENKSRETKTCKWAYDGAAAGKVHVGINLFKMTYSIPKVLTLAQWPGFKVKFLTTVCKINSAPFDIAYGNWRKGSVFFSGISGGTRYNDVGTQEWAFDMNFSVKLLPDTAFGENEEHENDWLRMLVTDPVAAQPKWDILNDANGVPILYAAADLNILLA